MPPTETAPALHNRIRSVFEDEPLVAVECKQRSRRAVRRTSSVAVVVSDRLLMVKMSRDVKALRGVLASYFNRNTITDWTADAIAELLGVSEILEDIKQSAVELFGWPVTVETGQPQEENEHPYLVFTVHAKGQRFDETLVEKRIRWHKMTRDIAPSASDHLRLLVEYA